MPAFMWPVGQAVREVPFPNRGSCPAVLNFVSNRSQLGGKYTDLGGDVLEDSAFHLRVSQLTACFERLAACP